MNILALPMGFFARLFGKAGYHAIIKGEKVKVLPLSYMDSYEKKLDRMSAALHTVSMEKDTRYVVSFNDDSGNKRFFDLPEQYAKLVLKE